MELRHLITYYLWSRSFSHKELAKILNTTEKIILEYESGRLFPDCIEAEKIQKLLAIPKIKFWTIYFNNLMRILGSNKSYNLLNYDEQKKYVDNSIKLRKQFKHNATPSDECHFLNTKYELNPQTFSTVLSVRLRFGLSNVDLKKQKKQLAKKYEIDVKEFEKILKGILPTFKQLKKIINHNAPGIDREFLLSGYVSQVIEKLDLNLFVDDEINNEALFSLNRMGRDQVFRKK